MNKTALKIENLCACINSKEILKNFNLEIKEGEVHAIMGPNGSGKSTLSNILAGKKDYEITSGTIDFYNQSIINLSPDERANLGIFLAFQYPVEIAGVNNAYFLRAALNAVRKSRNQEAIDAIDFLDLAKAHMQKLKMDPSFLNRALNEGFSGGEKKRNEILQMSILEPKLCILDETDSGLDIDALKICADGVNALRNDARSMIVVTHYQRLLNYIVPDVVHVMINGQIIKSGDKDLSIFLEKNGYDSFITGNACG